MTQEDVVRRIIEQDGCSSVSCDGIGGWNHGVKCPMSIENCNCHTNSGMDAKAWAIEHDIPLYSSTFTIAHRFKPGDRVQFKDTDTTWPYPPIVTVAKVALVSYGFIYRFVEDGVPACLISYCDKNLRLADCEEEVGKTKEIP